MRPQDATEDVTWEALPQRRTRRRRNVEEENEQEEKIVDDAVVVRSMEDYAAATVAKNVEQRAQMHRSQTTLESRDGCAGVNFEYLDHTADVQCHSWGSTIVKAFENMARCMLNYMTDIDVITEDDSETVELTVTGSDMQSLLYNYMNELLFKFTTDSFCAVRVVITEFDKTCFSIKAVLHGDIFDLSKHTCGTEIKAITYSNMQIHEKPDRTDLFVIVDI